MDINLPTRNYNTARSGMAIAGARSKSGGRTPLASNKAGGAPQKSNSKGRQPVTFAEKIAH